MAFEITRGIIVGAQKVVIYGPEGIGKSTFASQFPDPLFIDTEGSTKLLNVARLPRPTSWQMLLEQVRYVNQTPNICKTLVIDTADWAEQMCVEAICAKHSKKGIEDFGYGNGYVFVKEEMGRFLNLLSDLIETRIHVVLTAHAQIRKFEQPDESGSYDRWELKLGKKTSSQTSPLIKEWADMVLFANYQTMVVNVDGQGTQKGKNKAKGGKRVMYTSHHPCWDAKNRHGLAEEMDFSYAQIASCFQGRAQEQAAETQPPTMEPEPKKVQEPEKEEQSEKAVQTMETPAELPKPTPPRPGEEDKVSQIMSPEEPPEEWLRPLYELMALDLVSTDEIRQVVAKRGYYPIATPIQNYDKNFVDGVLIGAWEKVRAMVMENREEIPF